jgi:hypothetical protein
MGDETPSSPQPALIARASRIGQRAAVVTGNLLIAQRALA